MAILTLVVVVGGRFATKKKVTAKIVVSGLILALFVAVLAEAREDLAKGIAALILVGAVLTYAIPVLENVGKAK